MTAATTTSSTSSMTSNANTVITQRTRIKSSSTTTTTNDRTTSTKSDVEYDASKGVYYEVLKRPKHCVNVDLKSLPFYKQINWLSTCIIFIPLLSSLCLIPFTPLRRATFILSIIWYILTGIGITTGYHRLFSHRSYVTRPIVDYILLMFGAAAFQGSARWWSRNHRAHHRYIDSDGDPYAVHRGFWHAHWGWMIWKQDVRYVGRVDISDLNNHWGVMIQHQYYLPIALTIGFIIPLCIGTFGWNDFKGTLVYGCLLRTSCLQQATFCVNSVAHTFGHKTFSREHTSFDHILTALITFGEGYHNFHHEFPHDFRNGTRWFHYDPSKWLIQCLYTIGLCKSVIKFSDNELEKARLQVQQQDLDSLKQRIDWGTSSHNLQSMSWKTIEQRCKTNNETLIVINEIVHKVDDFVNEHPGGKALLKFWNGRDATNAFNGEVYKHSKAARNLLAHFRIAKLDETLE